MKVKIFTHENEKVTESEINLKADFWEKAKEKAIINKLKLDKTRVFRIKLNKDSDKISIHI